MSDLVIKKAIEIISKWEGFSETPYNCTAGVKTVGYGTLVKNLPKTEKYPMSKERAKELLYDRVEGDWYKVDALVNVSLQINQAAALVSLVYNIGLGAFKTSTLLKKLNAGDYKGACNEFARWNKSGGRVTKGLVNRRADEAKLFATYSATLGEEIVRKSKTIKAAQAMEVTGYSISGGTVAKVAFAAAPFASTFEVLAQNAPYIIAGLIIAGVAMYMISKRKTTAYKQRR